MDKNMERKSLFKPCIDIHGGAVKQIVGGTLSESDPSELKTNYVSTHSPSYYANLYKSNNLIGGHVIMLGKGNDEAALEALHAWPKSLQIGGGIDPSNARYWLDTGLAEKVIITSYLFPDAKFSLERLKLLREQVSKEELVIDVSCRKVDGGWKVAMNKWQTITEQEITKEFLDLLSEYCSEFLIHAADVEGLCSGIDEDLVKKLGEWVTIPATYAGGARAVSDLALVQTLSGGKVDLTYGSALDIFGGSLVKFEELVAFNQQSTQ